MEKKSQFQEIINREARGLFSPSGEAYLKSKQRQSSGLKASTHPL